MKKFICTVCGYVHEGDSAPEKCPQCQVPASKFKEAVEEEKVWAAEHVLGVANGVDPEIIEGLRQNFMGECTEVGMYLAMARVAHREGYPEIGLYWEKAAYEEAEHAAKFAELLGEVVTDSTKKNLEEHIYEAMDESMASRPFLITSKPHSAIRHKGFPLDSISKDLESGKYFYDMTQEEMDLFAVQGGFLEFFRRVGF